MRNSNRPRRVNAFGIGAVIVTAMVATIIERNPACARRRHVTATPENHCTRPRRGAAAWSSTGPTSSSPTYEPSQFVYGLKNGVAARLNIAPDQVRVVSRYIGGAFGSKGAMTPRAALIALAAKRLNRPVKLVATRAQGFTVATYRAETQHRIRLGAHRDGRLVGYDHQGREISSRPDPYVVAGVGDSAQLYAFGAVTTKVNVVHADRSTPGYMRSPPVVPYIYALESAMDEKAIEQHVRIEKSATLVVVATPEGPAAGDLRGRLQGAGFRIAKFAESCVNTGDHHRIMRYSLRWRGLPQDSEAPGLIAALAKADGVLQLQWKP